MGTGERVCFTSAGAVCVAALVFALSYPPEQVWHELWAVVVGVIIAAILLVVGVVFGVRRMEREDRYNWRERELRAQRTVAPRNR